MMMMGNRDLFLSNLCYYDKRNPDNCILEDCEKPNPCYCDNCFYGRNKLACAGLELLNKMEV